MRLLDTTTKQLRAFYGEKIPKYAILSHMWGREDDEVLFRHIAGSDADRHEGEMRKGYAKVEGACRQAVEDGWKYIWIDTCCIDKTSSAELSEAINSMYEWYQNSGVCYVYLEDVRSDSDRDGDHDSNRADEHDNPKEDNDEEGGPDKFQIVPFERSRWFKRGWTLQELIAPQFVVFYSKDWIDIGTKASLRETISAVTHIRVEMLMVYDPEKASVAEKISWAAFRKTTRVEDIAYCLMGLLGVNMPLLYGEGNRAFRRLQEELMKVSDDDSLFAWKCRFEKHDNYMDNTCGMLAASPWDFRDGMNIVRSQDGAHSPYSMTNQGLQIKLPLLHINPNLEHHPFDVDSRWIFKTILKCTVRDSAPIRWIVIYLKKIGEGQYERIFPHWLDEIDTPLSKKELFSLLVPQANTFPTRYHGGIESIRIKILPTESEFTVNGRSLLGGCMCSVRDEHEIISFKHQEKCFGVVIGRDRDIPWLDFIDVIDEKQSYDDLYKEGGPRVPLRERHLDRLCEKIPGVDWWASVSVKRTGHDSKYCFLAIINIQRESIWAKGRYNPPAISTNNSISGNFSLKYVHSDFKKEAHDWTALYNPKVERKLDISLVHTILPPKSSVWCIRFSWDGKYLATGDSSNIVRVYDMKTGTEICTFINESTKPHTSIYSICFSPNSKLIAAGDSKGCIKIWDIGAKCVLTVLNGHQSVILSLCFLQSLPGSHILISESKGRTVRIWEIANGTSRVFALPRENYSYPSESSIAVSPDGNFVAAGGLNGVIQIWNIATTQLLGELPEPGDRVHVAFTPDGKGLVSGSINGTLNYWDITSSTLAKREVGKQPTMTFIGWDRSLRVTSVPVSHDGHWVISKLRDDRLVFWDLNDATPQLILETRYYRKYEPLLATSPVSNMFATIDDDNDMVRVWRYDNIKPQGNPSSYVSA